MSTFLALIAYGMKILATWNQILKTNNDMQINSSVYDYEHTKMLG
jgi:hypothetical protein